MTKFYSINELSRLTMVSIRTLHHYHALGILKPNHRTEKGHRRYSEEDLFRLQQILTLKFMGFTLQEIKKILQQADFNIFDSLKLLEKNLLEQMTHIQNVTKLINYLILQHELNLPIDWKTVIQIFSVLKFSYADKQTWHESYLTDIERQQYNCYSMTRMNEWKTLFEEVKSNLTSDLANDDGELVKKWMDLAYESYGDQPELINKLWEAFKAGIIPSQLPNDKKVIAYITKAFEKLQQSAM